MFKHVLSNGNVVVSFQPTTVVEYGDWDEFVRAEAEAEALRSKLQSEWETWVSAQPSLSPEEYYGSHLHRAYKAHIAQLDAIPHVAFVGEEPLPQGPIQGFILVSEVRRHGVYGAWEGPYITHTHAVQAPSGHTNQIFNEQEALKRTCASPTPPGWDCNGY